MLFNSLEFLFIFLPITFFVYFFLNKKRLIALATGWMVAASLIFYGYWNYKYLTLIILSMIFNYTVGYTLSHPSNLKINRKLVLTIGIIGNVGLLCYYKYFDFLINNINAVFHSGFDTLKIALPRYKLFYLYSNCLSG